MKYLYSLCFGGTNILVFYTFAHLKRRINDEKNKQKCKNLINRRLETPLNLPSSVCPYVRGFQVVEERVLQSLSDKMKKKENTGFCIMWNIFIAEMVLLNPRLETITVITNIMEWVQKKSNGDMYMRNIIRGYLHYVYFQYNTILIENIGMNTLKAGKTLNESTRKKIFNYILSEYKIVNKHGIYDHI